MLIESVLKVCAVGPFSFLRPVLCRMSRDENIHSQRDALTVATSSPREACDAGLKPLWKTRSHSRAGVLTFYARAFFVKTINIIYFHFVILYVMQV